MMGFDPGRLPTVSRALREMSYPLYEGDVTAEPAVYNGRSLLLAVLAGLAAHHYRPALGLEGVI